jgi:hypothetical protein
MTDQATLMGDGGEVGASQPAADRATDERSPCGSPPSGSVSTDARHQSQLPPAENKFHVGNGDDGKHYWLTPPELYAELNAEFAFDFDPCPYPLPEGFDGLTREWGQSSYANIPFGSVLHQGPADKKPKKKGPTAWVRKALAEHAKGKRVVMVYPVDKWLLMLLGAGAQVRNLGDVRWCATEDGSQGKGTGRHIACFVLEPAQWDGSPEGQDREAGLIAEGDDSPVGSEADDAPTPSSTPLQGTTP